MVSILVPTAVEMCIRDRDRTHITPIAEIDMEDKYAVRAVVGTEPKVNRIRKGLTLSLIHISLRDGSKFRPWLLKTLSRAAWKYCRKAKRETPVSEFFDAGESESALSAVLRTDEQRRLYAALDTLDEKRRVTVVLYYFDDRSVRELSLIHI